MSDVTVTSPSANIVSPLLAQARTACADAVVRGYGATRDYACELISTFGSSWFVTETEEIKAEKTAFYTLLKAGNHSNPSVVWARVKKEAEKVIEAAKAPKGEEGEEAEGSGKAKHTRTPQLRYVEELTSLYKMGMREMPNLSEAHKKAHNLIRAALEAIGIDVSKI